MGIETYPSSLRFARTSKEIIHFFNLSEYANSLINTFFSILCQKCEKAYFDQRVECVAPKSWLKYTTSRCHFLRFVNFFLINKKLNVKHKREQLCYLMLGPHNTAYRCF